MILILLIPIFQYLIVRYLDLLEIYRTFKNFRTVFELKSKIDPFTKEQKVKEIKKFRFYVLQKINYSKNKNLIDKLDTYLLDFEDCNFDLKHFLIRNICNL